MRRNGTTAWFSLLTQPFHGSNFNRSISDTRGPLSPDTSPDASSPQKEKVASHWPKDTDLVLNAVHKLMLTNQNVVVHSVIMESFNILLGDLLFKNAYPNANKTFDFVQNAVLVAASRILAAKDVHRQLSQDNDYLLIIIPLVRCILFGKVELSNIGLATCAY
jgi:hypothetical protein